LDPPNKEKIKKRHVGLPDPKHWLQNVRQKEQKEVADLG
jgi:hypothetical protein